MAEIGACAELLSVASSPTTESTSYPFWIVVRGRARREFIAGIWFDRSTAEEWLRDHRHDPGYRRAYVWCASGFASSAWRELYTLSKALQQEPDRGQ